MDIIIRGKKLEGDFYDVDFIERYENGALELKNRTDAAGLNKCTSTAEGYRILIGIIEGFFDYVFGEGTSAMLFEGVEGKIDAHMKAVEDLAAARATVNKELNDMTNKYNQKQAASVRRQQAPWPPTPRPGNKKNR